MLTSPSTHVDNLSDINKKIQTLIGKNQQMNLLITLELW